MARTATVDDGQVYHMSDEHKAALAVGREQNRIVRNYLVALETHKPKRGRKRSLDSIEKRLAQINETVGSEGDPLRRLALIQERGKLEEALAHQTESSDLAELEEAFKSIAADYSNRRGISYAAWREVGVPANILKDAGIQRSA